jgi:hypothetical protein
MKEHIKLLFACVIMGVFALAGCNNPLADTKQQGTDPAVSGTVVVSIETPAGSKEARTIYPALDGFTRYELSFSGGPVAHESLSGGNITSITVTLPVGNWTITATAYSGEEDSRIASARGSTSVTIEKDKSVQASITLGPIPGGPKGTLHYSITMPEGAEGKLILQPKTGEDETEIPLTAGSDEENTYELPAGDYFLLVKLTNSKGAAGKMEVLHIYSGMESKVEFSFTADDFIVAAVFNPTYAGFRGAVGDTASLTNDAAFNEAKGSNTAVFTIVGGDTDVATIDPATGKLTLVGTGTIKVSLKITTADGTITHTGTSERIVVTKLFALTAGDPVPVLASDTTANVTFTGASGLSLSRTDFAVSADGTISSSETGVVVSGDTVTVSVGFVPNTGATPKTYTVSIASDSPTIKKGPTVVITQAIRKELTAVAAVDALASDTSAKVTFTGALGLSLSAADFAVSPGGTISGVAMSGETVTVSVGFVANTGATPNIYTVSIAPTSPKITGDATVVITQAIRVGLTAGTAVPALASATTADVIFIGASGLSLSVADFAVSTGGTISGVAMSGGTVTVSVGFVANTGATPKTYTVSIASASPKITGSETVVITQAIRKELSAGPAVSAEASDTSAEVTFTGASGLSLSAADFAVSPGGTISGVAMSGGTVTVSVDFAANTGPANIYTVSIASDSPTITGSDVTITQATATGGITITIDFNDYGEITINGNNGNNANAEADKKNVISKSDASTSLILSATTDYTDVAWYVDGDTTKIPGNSITLKATGVTGVIVSEVQRHSITFTGKASDGRRYSSRPIYFTVLP